MKLEKYIGDYIDKKVSLIASLLVIFILVVFLLIISGSGILAAISQGFALVIAIWNFTVAMGKLTMILGVFAAISALFVFMGGLLTFISNPKKWFR